MDSILITQITSLSFGITTIFSQAGLPSKFKPAFNLAVAVGVAFLTNGLSTSSVVLGLVSGLTCAGLYSGLKKT